VNGTQVTLELPAKAEYLLLARLALAGIAHAMPVEEDALADLKLAVTEACGNAVAHAYPGGAGMVHVTYEVGRDEIVVVVEDDGEWVEDVNLDDDPFSEGEPPESGMGLAIIRAIVDDVEVGPRAGATGTLVRMRKRIARAAG
jgi:serine/threonine-protein kinase RsbW